MAKWNLNFSDGSFIEVEAKTALVLNNINNWFVLVDNEDQPVAFLNANTLDMFHKSVENASQ